MLLCSFAPLRRVVTAQVDTLPTAPENEAYALKPLQGNPMILSKFWRALKAQINKLANHFDRIHRFEFRPPEFKSISYRTR